MFRFSDIRFIGPIVCIYLTVRLFYSMAEALYRLYVIFEGPPPQSEKHPFASVAMLPQMESIDAKIRGQGFKPLAVLRVKTKISPDTQSEWLYTNEEGTIWVEAIQLNPDAPAMAQYSSLFKDTAMIITRFPQGENISSANYHSRFAAQDINAAYQYHIQKIKEWSAERGKPRVVTSAEDVKTYDRFWHHTHRATDYGVLVWVYSVKALLALVAALLIAYTGLTIWQKGFEQAELYFVTFFVGLALAVGVNQIPEWMQQYRFRKSNAVDNRKSKPKRELAD